MKNTTRRVGIAVAVLGLIAAITGQAKAGLVFDNGSADIARTTYNMQATPSGVSDYTISDTFVLGSDTTVTGFDYDTWHIGTAAYQSTKFRILDALPSSNPNVLASGTLVAGVTSNGLINSTRVDLPPGFLHSVSGLSISLSAGTYYLELSDYSVGPGGDAIGSGYGSGQTVSDGLYQSHWGSDTLHQGDHMSFRIYDDTSPTLATPEPSTLALVFTAIPMGLGLAWKRRRKAVVA